MDEPEEIKIGLNTEHVIDLIGMGPAGYSWVYTMEKEDILTIFHRYITPPDPMPGESGIERFIIRGVNPGACMVEFRQIQSWEKDQPPLSAKKFCFVVS
jgi:hypothetical protein